MRLVYWVDINYPFKIYKTRERTNQSAMYSQEAVANSTRIGYDYTKAVMYSLRKLIKHLNLKNKPIDGLLDKLVALEEKYPDKLI